MRTNLPIPKNIEVAIGADFGISVSFTEGGETVDLTNWTFWAEIWNLGIKIDDFVITVADNIVTLSLPNSQTINYNPTKNAVWSLRFETPTGLRKDLFVGKASIVANPTLPTPLP